MRAAVRPIRYLTPGAVSLVFGYTNIFLLIRIPENYKDCLPRCPTYYLACRPTILSRNYNISFCSNVSSLTLIYGSLWLCYGSSLAQAAL